MTSPYHCITPCDSGSPKTAAVARAVAGAAGTSLLIDPVADQYRADPATVRAAGAEVRRILAIDKELGW